MALLKTNLTLGNRFVILDGNYDKAQLSFIAPDPKDRSKLTVVTYDHPGEPIITPLDNFSSDYFPDLLHPRIILTRRQSELRSIFIKIQHELAQTLYGSSNRRLTLNQTLKKLVSLGCADNSEAEAMLMLYLARGLFTFTKLKKEGYISLNKNLQGMEDMKRFLHSITDELISKSDRIELLVKHNVSKGNYREMLLRSVLQKYVPKKYEVVTGFIEGCHRQCDIIIYDSHNFSPYFREGDLVVVPHQSVRAVIEVKTTLDAGALEEALDLLSDISRNYNDPAPFFRAVFAFKKGNYKTDEALATAVKKFYHRKDAKSGKDNTIHALFETINTFCVMDEQCLVTDVVDYTFNDHSIRPRIYSVRSSTTDLRVYSAAFFRELFSYLDVEKRAKRVTKDYFWWLNGEMLYYHILDLYDRSWKPLTQFKNEHDWTEDGLWQRVSDLYNWKAGLVSAQDMEEKYFAEILHPRDLQKIAKGGYPF
ncbi:DUF6602 domain-containing protein [Pedobacter chitinilyticus]|uniref:DUF6602 domain-containing protein n=1 Tax=Pedobacter chitinilyticus TaxID=2233776 RepID=A0A443YW29_9SPHI|nr:DUF6602 domain-containing protein [Pedobacter chitinilyticus]RWU08173.1 hypothetical protein DPV69_07265 [Pedobacter chitinilyticus]